MDWSRREQAMYEASRYRFDKQPKWQALMRSVGPNNPQIQERPVPGDVGSLPPRERIERDPDLQRITTEQVGTPKHSRTTNGKGRSRGSKDFTAQRRYRKADRVKRPIEIV